VHVGSFLLPCLLQICEHDLKEGSHRCIFGSLGWMIVLRSHRGEVRCLESPSSLGNLSMMVGNTREEHGVGECRISIKRSLLSCKGTIPG